MREPTEAEPESEPRLRWSPVPTTLATTTILFLVMVASPATAIETTFFLPADDQGRIDVCLHWGAQCSGEAADVYCKVQGFQRTSGWDVDYDIGAESPTVVIGDGRVCRGEFFDAYHSITCERENEWTRQTGNGGLLVKVEWERELDLPVGALVIAVREDQPDESVSAVLDKDGTALLHARPGKYAVFLEDWKNPRSVGRPERRSVEV